MPSDKKVLKKLEKLLKNERKRRKRRQGHRSRSRSRSPRRRSPSASDSERTRTPSPSDSDTGSNEVALQEPADLSPLKEALGEDYEPLKKFEGQIQEDISRRWNHILVNGLTNEKEALMKKYKLPDNCKLLDAPMLNEEVKAILTENAKNRDKTLEMSQYQLGLATAIIGQVMSNIIDDEIDKVQLLKKLSDASKLLNDIHFNKTKTRRLLVSPLLDKSFVNFIENVKRDEHLFGMDLGTKIKTNQDLKKSSSTIKKPVTKVVTNKTNTKPRTVGNRNGPPPTQHQAKVSSQRGGPKNRTTQQSQFRRPGHKQTRPERAAPRHAPNRR